MQHLSDGGAVVWTYLIAIAGLIGSGISIVRANRNANKEILLSNQSVVKATAESWQSLAEVKSQEIDDLQCRFKKIEEKLATLTQEHLDTLKLNLNLQMENSNLKQQVDRQQKEISRLEQRVSELEMAGAVSRRRKSNKGDKDA